MHKLICGDCLDQDLKADCIFADPPDNIGLKYNEYKDQLADEDYRALLQTWVVNFIKQAETVWISFNARWTMQMGRIAVWLTEQWPDVEVKPCVQVFTFGQNRQTDLGNNHRPLWRFKWKDTPVYPEQIRVPSWRQRNGDKRADPRGRIPSDVFDMQYTEAGDVFDFPRVTGNSKQRCDWHVTQLHEDLVERCIKLSTREGDHVLDPFGGTGTTLRVCKKINRACTLIELDPFYCQKIAEAHQLKIS
jgi:site-specific DNA-methyltransferase (adenine-specific)